MAVAGDFVTVACKLPNGFVLQNRAAPTYIETSQGTHIVAGPVEDEVRLRGSSAQRRMESNGETMGEHQMVSGGYGLTPNVPRSTMERWLADCKDTPLVKNNLIFIADKGVDYARSKAREQSEIKSGLEPMTAKDMKKAGVEPISKDD